MGKLIDGSECGQCFHCHENEGGYEQTIYCKDCFEMIRKEGAREKVKFLITDLLTERELLLQKVENLQNNIAKIEEELKETIKTYGNKKTESTASFPLEDGSSVDVTKKTRVIIKPQAVNYFKEKGLPQYITTSTNITVSVKKEDFEKAFTDGAITQEEKEILSEVNTTYALQVKHKK
jgi:hypothetical protein